MTATQRKLAHKLASELRLGHESRGEGAQRRVYVWWPEEDDTGAWQSIWPCAMRASTMCVNISHACMYVCE